MMALITVWIEELEACQSNFVRKQMLNSIKKNF